MPEYGEPLTEREKEILLMVATGVTNRQVAYRLSISINTVKVHLRNIFTKLGAESRTEATMIAVQEGWVGVEGAGRAAEVPETTVALPQTPPVAPTAPLPWLKRATLIAALLLVVTGVTVTWPRSTPQAGNGSDLPLDESREPSTEIPLGTEESLWHERAQMPTRRAHLTLSVVGERIFAIAGQTPDGITAAVEVYDPQDDIWTRRSDKPTPVTHVSGAAIGTDVYVPGGCDANGTPTQAVEVYDTLTDAWREASSLPAPRCAYALAVLGERLYLFGGWDGQRYVSTAYVYDSQADTWAEESPMHGGGYGSREEPRKGLFRWLLDTIGRILRTLTTAPTPESPTQAGRAFAAAAALGDRIYVVGGYDGEQELTTCTIYDPATKMWEECAPLAVGRGGLGLVAIGGQLYAVGGGGWTSFLGFNERYNPSNDTWSVIETPLVDEWRSPGVVALDTTIYAIGGWRGDYLSLNHVYEALPFRIFIPVSHQQ
jgi:DNA-binding CsgD family transcriptional regulator/N-acetylneuraminic acid mutarotase